MGLGFLGVVELPFGVGTAASSLKLIGLVTLVRFTGARCSQINTPAKDAIGKLWPNQRELKDH